MSSAKSSLNRTLAWAQKDLTIQLRFKISFLQGLFAPALANFGLFGTVFFGFIYAASEPVGGVTKANFIAFTLLGTLSSTLFSTGFSTYTGRFQYEKYWQTILVVLASPLSPTEMLLGVTISDLLRFSIVAAVFLVLADIFAPVSLGVALLSALFLVLIYWTISGISLIRGALLLADENADTFFQYFVLVTGYLSCFYFPLSFVPSILRPFAMINPVYWFVYSIRAIWLGLPLNPEYPLIGVLATIASIGIGTYLFRKIWRNLDITGY